MHSPLTSSDAKPSADARPSGKTRPSGGRTSFGFRALAEAVASIAAPLLGRRGLADGRVVAEWASIVGEPLAVRSLPEKLVRAPEGRGGTLHVRVGSGALALELQHLEPVVLERINTYFGYRAVERLKLVQGPLPACATTGLPPPSPTPADEARAEALVADIDDPELRRTLAGLGKQLYARSK
jgi:hypothetical protein